MKKISIQPRKSVLWFTYGLLIAEQHIKEKTHSHISDCRYSYYSNERY